MATDDSAEVLERYWNALQAAEPTEALRLREEIAQRFQLLQSSFDLLDEIKDASELVDWYEKIRQLKEGDS